LFRIVVAFRFSLCKPLTHLYGTNILLDSELRFNEFNCKRFFPSEIAWRAGTVSTFHFMIF